MVIEVKNLFHQLQCVAIKNELCSLPVSFNACRDKYYSLMIGLEINLLKLHLTTL